MTIGFIIEEEPHIRHSNVFVVTVDGYWGDGDAEHYSKEVFDCQQKAEAYTHMFYMLKNGNREIEDDDQMREWLEKQGYGKYDFNFPTDDGCMVLSSIDTLCVEYYDKYGHCHKVHLQELT